MHSAEISWICRGDFAAGTYSRAHDWHFDGGVTVPASASPGIVAPPLSEVAAVDPEEAFIASIAACHMLWFLDFAQRAGLRVAAYRDRAEGALRHQGGRSWIPQVTLNIAVTFDGPAPEPDHHRALHDQAHHACFIANSIKTEIVTNLLEGE